MTSIYRAIFLLSIVVMFCGVIVPARTGIPIDRRLAGFTNEWFLTINTSNGLLVGADAERSKTMLLEYIRKNQKQDHGPLEWLALPALVTAIFSFVGWRREAARQRQRAEG